MNPTLAKKLYEEGLQASQKGHLDQAADLLLKAAGHNSNDTGFLMAGCQGTLA